MMEANYCPEHLADTLRDLAGYWREQAQLWAEQEKAWHEVVLYCRGIRSKNDWKHKE